MDRRDLIAFTVSGRCLALPLADVRRVVPLPRLIPPTGAPPFLEGFFDLHGSEVGVLRADILLDLGEETLGVYSPLLLLANDEPPLALHVASVLRIVKGVEMRRVGRDESFNSSVVGRFDYQGKPAYLLSVKHILLAEERSRVSHHRDVMRRRLDALAQVPVGAVLA